GDRRRALVDDLVLEGEEIVFVDGDGAPELESLAVVVDEGHRPADRKRARALLLPDRVRTRQFHCRAARRGPAEFGVERIGAAGRRGEHDRRRVGIDRLAIVDQREIVDAAALECDRARETWRVGGAAGRGCGRGGSGHWLRGGRAGLRRRLRCGARCRGGRRRAGLLGKGRRLLRTFLRLLLLDLLLLLHLRQAEIDLPRDQNERREHDGENGVLL